MTAIIGSAIRSVLISTDADQSFSPVTLADVTDLGIELLANVTYAYEFFIALTMALQGNTYSFKLNGPALTYLRGTHLMQGGTAEVPAYNTVSGYNTPTPNASVNGAGVLSHSVMMQGQIRCSAQGILQVRCNVTAGSTLTVKAGSWGRLTALHN